MHSLACIILVAGSLQGGVSGEDRGGISGFAFALEPVWSQIGDYYGESDYGGGYGRQGQASARNIRLSFHFLAAVLQSTDAMDVPSGGNEPWTEYWSAGLGGGLDISYHPAPGFRFGAGAGYHVFPGKEDDLGWAEVRYGSIQCIPIQLDAAVCFPFMIPSSAWFKTGAGFVPGLAPYIGVELAGVYRSAVEWEFTSGPLSSEAEVFASGFSFYFGARAGFEFRGRNYGIFADVGYRVYLPPKEGDDLGAGVEILNMMAMPIRVGVAIYFGAGAAGRY